MLRSIIPLLLSICLMTASCHNNKNPVELINTFLQHKQTLDLLISDLQKDNKLDSLFQIMPDSGIPDIKNSYPQVYALIKKVGITAVSSHPNSFPKRTRWYYFKTNWPNEYPIYLIFNAYDSSETKKGFYLKDEVSNETFGLGDNWTMFRFVKVKPYKQ